MFWNNADVIIIMYVNLLPFIFAGTFVTFVFHLSYISVPIRIK